MCSRHDVEHLLPYLQEGEIVGGMDTTTFTYQGQERELRLGASVVIGTTDEPELLGRPAHIVGFTFALTPQGTQPWVIAELLDRSRTTVMFPLNDEAIDSFRNPDAAE